MANSQCIPTFKAGLNSGIVTIAEIGKYKKEIAYHGDTINIAARIQGKCNEFGYELLVSENLMMLIQQSVYKFNNLESIELKSKLRKVSVYAVTKPIKQ